MFLCPEDDTESSLDGVANKLIRSSEIFLDSVLSEPQMVLTGNTFSLVMVNKWTRYLAPPE